jgi:hypothetical protein
MAWLRVLVVGFGQTQFLFALGIPARNYHGDIQSPFKGGEILQRRYMESLSIQDGRDTFKIRFWRVTCLILP